MRPAKLLAVKRETALEGIVAQVGMVLREVGLLSNDARFKKRPPGSSRAPASPVHSSKFLVLPKLVAPEEFLAVAKPEVTDVFFLRICSPGAPFEHAFSAAASEAFLLKFLVHENQLTMILSFSKTHQWMLADFNLEIFRKILSYNASRIPTVKKGSRFEQRELGDVSDQGLTPPPSVLLPALDPSILSAASDSENNTPRKNAPGALSFFAPNFFTPSSVERDLASLKRKKLVFPH